MQEPDCLGFLPNSTLTLSMSWRRMKLLGFSCRVHEGFRSAIGLGLARPELFSEYLVQMKVPIEVDHVANRVGTVTALHCTGQ